MDRPRSDMATLANQIDDCPVVFPTLKVTDSQIRKLTAAKPATQQNSQNRTIALTL